MLLPLQKTSSELMFFYSKVKYYRNCLFVHLNLKDYDLDFVLVFWRAFFVSFSNPIPVCCVAGFCIF